MKFSLLTTQVYYFKLSTLGYSQLNNMWAFSCFPKFLYNTKRLPDIGYNLSISQRYKLGVVLIPLFYIKICFVKKWILFFVRLIYWIFEPFPPLYRASKYSQLVLFRTHVLQRNYLIILTSRVIRMFYWIK